MTPKYDVDWAARAAEDPRTKFLFFWGHQIRPDGVLTDSVFSQWYPAPFTLDGIRYPTVEHWMMAEKARLFADPETLGQILATDSPGKAKALGRTVRGFDQTVWKGAAYQIVLVGSRAKFDQNPDLGDYLRKTGRKILVEASPQDAIWGIGLARDHEDAREPILWPGTNLLGFALMELRDELQESPT